jgi:hypothetical protein
MSQDALNVHNGPARIWLGMTAPASGIPPTWALHTAGVPATGTEVGFTDGDAVFRKNKTTFEINAEQAMGPIAVGLSGEIVEVEFTALERVYTTLQAGFDNAGTVNDVTRMGFYGGGMQYPIRTQTVFMSSLRPNQAGKYEISMIYKAYNTSGIETSYRKGAGSMVKMVLRGLQDTTRSVGDQLYQFSIEK